MLSNYTQLVRGGIALCLLMCCVHSARADWEWARTCGNLNIQSIAHSVTTDAAGNVIVAGIFQNTLVVGADTFTTDGKSMFLIKYDAFGNILWAKSPYGGVSDLVPPSVKTDANNNIIISGNFGGDLSFDSATVVHGTGIDHDFFIVKYDPSGTPLWARAYGGNVNDFATAVATDKAGNIFVTGHYNSTSITFGSVAITNVNPVSTGLYSNFDIFLAKYDAFGSFQWARNVGNKGDEKSNSVVTDTFGNVYVAGSFEEGDSAFVLGDTLITPLMWSGINSYTILYKYDAWGNRMWAKYAEGGGATHLAIGKTGDVYMAGIFQESVMFFGGRFDPAAISLENAAYKVHYVCPTGVCLIPKDVFVARYSSNGQLLWARDAGGIFTDMVTAMALDPADNVYIAGTAQDDSIYFGANLVTKEGPMGDKFWARYGSNGEVKGGFLGLNPRDITSMSIANTGAIYFAGDYTLQLYLGPIELSCSYLNNNMFVAKCDEKTLGVQQYITPLTNAVCVYPNPNNGQMKVSLGAGGYNSIQVTDCVGRTLYSSTLSGAETMIDLQFPLFAPGVYVLKVTGTGKSGQVLFEKN
jgi:hypothetical protein